MSGFSLLILIILGLVVQVAVIALGVQVGTKAIRSDLAELKGQPDSRV
jgi:hypothetical protein